MAKKRTELPPELVAEWADDRTIEEVLATPGKLGGGTKAKVKWRCQVKGCGHEWQVTSEGTELEEAKKEIGSEVSNLLRQEAHPLTKIQ